MPRVVTLAVFGLAFLAFPASAWAEEQGSDSPSAVAAPSPVAVTAEVGGGQTTPAPASPTSTFLYQRASARWSATRKLDLAATFRTTEDLARAPDAGSAYRTSADLVFYGGLNGSYEVSDHFTLTLGVNGSPSSQRDVAAPILAPQPNGASASVDAAVRSTSSSVGGLVEVGYDSADDEKPHDVDVAIDVSGAVTRFATAQSVLAPDAAAAELKPMAASLVQARVGAVGTLTLAEHTDVALDVAYFVYDQANPGDVGLFTSSASSGLTTSFGAGLPMLPPRFTLRPEIGERIGPVALLAYYQYADLAVDQATGHTVGGRAQIAIGKVKLFAVGSYRADVFSDATAATWTAGAGVSVRL